MRRVISAALAMVMVMAISIPAFAIDKEREVSRLAYMNLDQASEAMQEKILQAREEIIFSKSWVADGLQGFVYDKDGNVIEEVPQFSEIFPADWDMFQVRHYANKLSGKLHYDSFMQFLEFYKRIFDINGTFKTEGKVVF